MPKITPNFYTRSERKLTVSGIHFGEKKVPALRLTGNWLLEAGFNLSQKVSVQVEFGQILIRPIEEESLCQ